MPEKTLYTYWPASMENGTANTHCWYVNASWAHPAWHDYLVMVVDLDSPCKKPPMKVREDMTHEFLLWAVDPRHDAPISVEELRDLVVDGNMFSRLLRPANYGYQFVATLSDGDEEEWVRDRIQAYVKAIERKHLSPDIDLRRVWDQLFIDGCTLLQSGLAK